MRETWVKGQAVRQGTGVGRGSRLALALLWWFSGCAVVQTRTAIPGATTRSTAELGFEQRGTDRVSVDVVDGAVRARLLHPGTCVRSVTTTTAQTVQTRRQFSGPAYLSWGLPIVGLAVGGFYVVSGFGLVPSPSSTTQPGEVRPLDLGLGIALATTGLTWLIVNLVRTRTSVDDAQPEVTTTEDVYSCPQVPRTGEDLVLRAGDATVLRATTGARGDVDVPAQAQDALAARLGDAAVTVEGRPGALVWSEPAYYLVGARSLAGQLAYLDRYTGGAHATTLRRQSGARVLAQAAADVTAALDARDAAAVERLSQQLGQLQLDDADAQAERDTQKARLDGFLREQAERAHAAAVAAAIDEAQPTLRARDAAVALELVRKLDALAGPGDGSGSPLRRTRDALEATARAQVNQLQRQATVAIKAGRYREAVALAPRLTQLGGDGDAVLAAAAAASDAARVVNWKGFLGRCQRVHADLDAIGRVGACDATCERIRGQIQAALDALRADVPPLPDAEEPRAGVQQRCAESACSELCP